MKRTVVCMLSLLFLCLGACAPQPVVFQPTPPAATTQAHGVTPTRGLHCPGPDTTVDFASHFFAPGLGQSPIWAVFSMNGRVALSDTDQSQRMEHGLPVKLLWTIERTHAGMVTISGKNSETGAPLWFMINGQPATTAAALDPHQPAIPFQHEGYAEFPGYILLDQPGCYVLQASTAPEGARWQRTFLVTK